MADPYIGEIRLFAGTFAPAGWAFCDGTRLAISEYDALFALIGTTYGGDGQQTFALPDLRGRVPIHQGSGPGLTPRVMGEAAGAERVTLAPAQIPQHQHVLVASGGPGTSDRPGGNVLATPPVLRPYAVDPPDVDAAASVVGAVGGSQPHENRQPYLALNFIISLFGVYPTPA